jgi:hypothetical protein
VSRAPYSYNSPRARRTGFYHRVGAPRLQGSGPSPSPHPKTLSPTLDPLLDADSAASYRLKRPRPAISAPSEASTSPTTSVKSPFLKGLGLTGLSGTTAFPYTLAVNWLPVAALAGVFAYRAQGAYTDTDHNSFLSLVHPATL